MVKRIALPFLLLLYCFPFSSAEAQTQPMLHSCGYSSIVDKEPALKKMPENRSLAPANKTSTTSSNYAQQHPIPVIFHIIVTDKQLAKLGGLEGVEQRVASQIEVVNADFNRNNSDSSKIPAAFKPAYGDVGIRFALAAMDPWGNASKGFEVKITGKDGFELYSEYKSGLGFTEARYTESGGLDAWDPTAYLNIWVLNPLENDTPSRLSGLTIPPAFVSNQTGIPLQERGIVLHYGAFGKRQQITDYYIYGGHLGRTLTHELGHYFNLRHPWGDDEGACPGDGTGMDDGIADTPPQARETYGSPRYPLYDSCTGTGAGIMFMNYMDYTIDQAKNMFTRQQAARMQREVSLDGASFSLTRQPHLLEHGGRIELEITVYPNPTVGALQIFFGRTPEGLKKIALYNSLGTEVYVIDNIVQPLSHFRLETGRFAAGIYFLSFQIEGKRIVKKLQISN